MKSALIAILITASIATLLLFEALSHHPVRRRIIRSELAVNLLGNYEWFRRMHGGKWTKWDFEPGHIWLPNDES